MPRKIFEAIAPNSLIQLGRQYRFWKSVQLHRKRVRQIIQQSAPADLTTPERLTVLICAFNKRRHSNIRISLESLMKCSFIDKIIISNNNSNTRFKMSKRHRNSKIHLIQQSTTMDCGHRFEMLQSLAGPWLALLDDDIFLLPNQLAELFQQLVLDPSRAHGIAGGDFCLSEAGDHQWQYKSYRRETREVDVLNIAYFASKSVISHYCAVRRKLKGTPNLDQALLAHDDVIMGLTSPVKPMMHNVGDIHECRSATYSQIAFHLQPKFQSERTELVKQLIRLRLCTKSTGEVS